jgi:hypothetical protein
MTGLNSDSTRRNSAPAKIHAVGAEDVGEAKWPRRRTLIFVVVSCVILWSLIGIGLWLVP